MKSEFDAAMTVDAMENVFPEDWPAVLANLRRAVRPGGHLYLTVEEVPETDLDEAFADLSARGLPVVRGEVIEGDVAGYHFYPGRDQVARWLEAEGLAIVDQDTEALEDWGYWHLLLRVAADVRQTPSPFEVLCGRRTPPPVAPAQRAVLAAGEDAACSSTARPTRRRHGAS